MKWTCGLLACLACLPAIQATAGPSTAPTSRPADLVPLEVELPRWGFDGEWQLFEEWRRKRPDAENCTEKLAPFLVPRGTRNLALHRPVTSSEKEPTIGELGLITDGYKEGTESSYVELGERLQYVGCASAHQSRCAHGKRNPPHDGSQRA